MRQARLSFPLRLCAILSAIVLLPMCRGLSPARAEQAFETPTPDERLAPAGEEQVREAAPLIVDVTGGRFKPFPVAIAPFSGASDSMAREIETRIRGNLRESGLFTLAEPSYAPVAFNRPPDFGKARADGSVALVVGNAVREADGALRVQFRLWDLLEERQWRGLRYRVSPGNWRRVAHKISDEIYEAITGEGGYFDSRVLYVEESGPKNRRVKRLALMDQDGAALHYLTDGRQLVLTPRFSPDGREAVYVGYVNDIPQIYLADMVSGKNRRIARLPGLAFSPRFSPDGREIVMSISREGETNLYRLDREKLLLRRITHGWAIDTSPSYAPDGTRIAFESDRSGTQQIYVIDKTGRNLKRISHGGGRYGTPVWSPRGDLIAFTKITRAGFHIGVMAPDGSGERLLTRSFLDEAPSWAPNGRVLIFLRQPPGGEGLPRLYSIDIRGRHLRRLDTPRGASDPSWSPLKP